jgi:hypothetical protein
MNVEIGAEDALFPEKEYMSGIFVAVQVIPADDLLAAKLNSSCTVILAALFWMGNHAWQQPLIHQDGADLGGQGAQQQFLSSCSQSQSLPQDQASGRGMISITPLFPGAGCSRPEMFARTTCPASLLVVHLAAIPAPVVANQACPTPAPPMEDTLTAAPKGPDQDKTSAAPAPVSAVQLLQPLLNCVVAACTPVTSIHFLQSFFNVQKNFSLLL